jgi:hypothetical protein
MNDTSRELGSALGIAVLGAALNDAYRSGMIDATKAVPVAIAEKLQGSVAFTQMPKPAAIPQQLWDGLVVAARHAFTDGMHNALLLVAALSLLGALLVFTIAPKHPAHLQQHSE